MFHVLVTHLLGGNHWNRHSLWVSMLGLIFREEPPRSHLVTHPRWDVGTPLLPQLHVTMGRPLETIHHRHRWTTRREAKEGPNRLAPNMLAASMSLKSVIHSNRYRMVMGSWVYRPHEQSLLSTNTSGQAGATLKRVVRVQSYSENGVH